MGITVKQILDLALAQEGYLEKASAKNEDSFTANAGSNNYTKFGRDLKAQVGSPYADGVAWCDEFCDWLFLTLGGKKAIKEQLYGYSAYTPTSAQYFKDNNAWYTGKAPKPGYQIFFKNSQRICHTGMVVKCENGMVYTIEGNTSSAPGVVANGGCVRQKSYSVSYSGIAGYGIPKCAQSQTEPYVAPTVPLKSEIVQVQKYLNKNFMPGLIKAKVFTANLKEDGEYGKLTRHAILAVWKTEMNAQFNCGLTPKNSAFGVSCNACSSKCPVKKGDKGTFPLIAQMLLKVHGFYHDVLDGDFGKNSCQAVVDFERAYNLIVNSLKDAVCSQQVWYKLFNS